MVKVKECGGVYYFQGIFGEYYAIFENGKYALMHQNTRRNNLQHYHPKKFNSIDEIVKYIEKHDQYKQNRWFNPRLEKLFAQI